MIILGGGRRWASAPATFSQIRAAMRRKTSACGLSGSATVIGLPLSEVSRIAMSSGTSPRNSMPSRSASLAGAAVAEDLAAPAAMRAQEIAHVLDDAEHRHVDLLEHVQPLARVDEGDVLRRRDDDRARERHLLRHRQLRVAGARRHVDDHDVELAPVDVAQHLLQCAHHHRPAPDHRRVLRARGTRSTCS